MLINRSTLMDVSPCCLFCLQSLTFLCHLKVLKTLEEMLTLDRLKL